jgi:hypothetical protein
MRVLYQMSGLGLPVLGGFFVLANGPRCHVLARLSLLTTQYRLVGLAYLSGHSLFVHAVMMLPGCPVLAVLAA